jgi:hypothetical protein
MNNYLLSKKDFLPWISHNLLHVDIYFILIN